MRELEGVGPKNLDFFGPEMATSETHLHKITNIPVFIYDFDVGKFITRKGVGPENLDFFGAKWHLLARCHFRARPFRWPL